MGRRLTIVLAAVLLAGACQSSSGGSGSSVPPTSVVVESTTLPPTSSTTVLDGPVSLGNQPQVINEIISPSWVTADHEDPGALIQSILDGGERPEPSVTMELAVLEKISTDGSFPYLYTASFADGLTIRENLAVRLGNEDSLSVDWHYVWADTPECDSCGAHQVLWDNGWLVWTSTDPDRGMLLYLADHSALTLSATISFFPDPIEWPEAAPEANPILLTTAAEADLTAASILDDLTTLVPIPER